MIAALLAPVALIAQAQVYTAEQFATLKFLEGRWTGTAPDGTAFFEQYDLGATILRMRRFGDPSFVTMSDESQIMLEGGRIESRWDDHSWHAVELGDGLVRFEAIDAPNGFSLRRVDANTIEVQQRWRNAKGKPQMHALRLHRLK
ncbi:hypothetical protein IAG41_12475 [Sphingomonas sp. JC676]|uniref:hypothetical protein n=1 Tax=Sphingomonas sp. JC676 TaxID=2768065 RepID=UPI0016585BD7|nr:hypothetical protein [Sphingomonas sp. JC676]MBC9033206.1 hypothetical protein [Sphingomonas sp. JC676]